MISSDAILQPGNRNTGLNMSIPLPEVRRERFVAWHTAVGHFLRRTMGSHWGLYSRRSEATQGKHHLSLPVVERDRVRDLVASVSLAHAETVIGTREIRLYSGDPLPLALVRVLPRWRLIPKDSNVVEGIRRPC